MEDTTFTPIILPKTNVITRRCYRYVKVIRAEYKRYRYGPVLEVEFEVCKGKNLGFRLKTGFGLNNKGAMYRLAYLCQAVGITGKLGDPDQLMGKKLKIRIVPKDDEYQGRRYRKLIITRFHRV
jgi:hypothetical protein